MFTALTPQADASLLNQDQSDWRLESGTVNLTPEEYRILFGEAPPVSESRPETTDPDPPLTEVRRKLTFDVPVTPTAVNEFQLEHDPAIPGTSLVLVPPVHISPDQSRPKLPLAFLALAVFLALVASPFLLERFRSEPDVEVLQEAVVAVEPTTTEPNATTPVEETTESSSELREVARERALSALGSATVVPLEQVSSGFDPENYLADTWPDSDDDCQSDREEVLIERSLVETVLDVDDCRVTSGSWVDPLTGLTHTDPSELRVIRTIPLQIAHQAGAANWTRAEQRAFAVDAAFDSSLMVVAESTDSDRGERGPDEWQPTLTSQCAYAINWVLVKTRWSLTYTAQEVAALEQMLTTCRS